MICRFGGPTLDLYGSRCRGLEAAYRWLRCPSRRRFGWARSHWFEYGTSKEDFQAELESQDVGAKNDPARNRPDTIGIYFFLEVDAMKRFWHL